MRAREIMLVCLIIVAGVTASWYVTQGRAALGRLGAGGWEGRFGMSEAGTKAYTEPHEQTIPGTGVRLVRLRTEYGSVTVEGWDGTDVKLQATKTARMRAGSPEPEGTEQLANIRIKASTEGDTLDIVTEYGDRLRSCRGWSVDYDLKVPRTVSLDIVTTHGKVQATGVQGDAALTTSFADIDASQVGGSLQARADHGGTAAAGIGKDATLDASYGFARAEDVGGTLHATTRFSSVEAKRIGGDAHIEASYQGVTVEDVKGSLEVQASFAGVDARDVAGDATLKTSFAGVTVRGAKQAVEAETQHGAVDVADCPGALSLTTSYAPVSVEGAHGPVTVSDRYGAVNVAFAEAPAGDVNVTTSFADATITAPADAPMTVDASTSHGSVACGYSVEGSVTEGAGASTSAVTGKINGGGPAVTVRDQFGGIRVVPR